MWQTFTTNPEYDSKIYVEKTDKQIEKFIGSDGGKRFEFQDKALDTFFTAGNKLRSRRNKIISPMGSGKSSIQLASAILDVIGTKYTRRQLFVMPQCHISEGFFKPKGGYTKISVRGEIYNVACLDSHNFCEKSSIARLKEWLLADPKTLAKYSNSKKREITGLFAMTSNQALAIAFYELLKECPAKAIKIFRNLHLRLDESHHLAMGTESEEAEEKDDSNKLGDVIKHLVDNDTGTSAFTMSTATDFRGDGKKQMWDSLRKETKIFQRDFAQHFKTLGVKTFRLEIQEFKSNPIKQFVRHLKKEKTEYHYVAVPPCNVSWRKDFTEDTDWGVDVLINEIKKAWKGVRILNLVPDEERSGELGTKKALLKEPKKPSAGEPQYDIVLTCMLGREGTDWCPASRIHVLYAERSITLSVQTLGRVSRRFRRTDKDDPKSVVYLKSRYARSGEGKQTIIARYYYPFFPEPKKGMTKDELLDGRKNGLLLMLQAEEQFLPILYPEIPSVTTKGKKGTGDKPLSLAELLGEKYQDLKEDFVTAIVEFGAQGMTCTDFDAIVDELLTEYEVPEQYLQVSKEALQVLYLRHSNIAFRGIDISFVREHGFPQLYKRVKDKSLVFGHSVKNMKLLKKIVQESFDAMLEMIEHKIEMVMHLPKSERYDAAGFTRQERAWISLRREEYGL